MCLASSCAVKSCRLCHSADRGTSCPHQLCEREKQGYPSDLWLPSVALLRKPHLLSLGLSGSWSYIDHQYFHGPYQCRFSNIRAADFWKLPNGLLPGKNKGHGSYVRTMIGNLTSTLDMDLLSRTLTAAHLERDTKSIQQDGHGS